MRLTGIYQPHPRRAYGRRKFCAALIEDVPASACLRLPDVPASIAKIVRGDNGRRYILCPMCQRCCAALYNRSGGYLWQCRVCAGLRYMSEYQLRRPEAAVERRHELRRRAKRTKSPETRKRCLARVNALSQAAMLRMEEEQARESDAFVLAALPLLIKEQAREAKYWRRMLLAALRTSKKERRKWVTPPRPENAPEWFFEVLEASLHMPTPPRRGAPAAAKVQVPSEGDVVLEATAAYRSQLEWLAKRRRAA